MARLKRPQRIGLLLAALALALAVVLFLQPVGSAPVSNSPGADMTFCGSVAFMEHDAGHCGTRLATRRTWATLFLAGGLVMAVGSVWALRPDVADA